MLPAERVGAVETGACPHAAIRKDVSVNLETIEELEDSLPPLDLILAESGGGQPHRHLQPGPGPPPELCHRRRRRRQSPPQGPGVSRSDLLVINKADLAAQVGANLGVMARGASAKRGDQGKTSFSCRKWRGQRKRVDIDELFRWTRGSPTAFPDASPVVSRR